MTERVAKCRFGGFAEVFCFCVCVYLTHGNNVFAPSQSVLGLFSSGGVSERARLFACACGWVFGCLRMCSGWFEQGVCLQGCRQSS